MNRADRRRASRPAHESVRPAHSFNRAIMRAHYFKRCGGTGACLLCELHAPQYVRSRATAEARGYGRYTALEAIRQGLLRIARAALRGEA